MVSIDPTPNPNALKFTVGSPVGGPATFVAGRETDDPMATALLALPGVSSIFMTADFVTVSKAAEGDWDDIIEPARMIIAEHFE
ncbi:MAG: NifU N-terminal domain-containing protein [Acidimicrobiia bacterium]